MSSRSHSEEAPAARRQDRVVIGAGLGIGEACALALSKAGATVIVADIDASKTAKVSERTGTHQRKPQSIKVDVGDVSDIQKTVDQIVKDFGRIDSRVNTANHPFMLVTPVHPRM